MAETALHQASIDNRQTNYSPRIINPSFVLTQESLTASNIQSSNTYCMQHKTLKSVFLFALSVVLFSFSSNWGGDSYQIYINKKLVMKEFVHNSTGAKSFSMDKATYDDQVEVYYSHCGQVGKNRTIALKDENNRLIKELHFADYAGNNSGMSFKVSDYLNWEKRNGIDQVNIYYSAKELPGGRLLASIQLGQEAKAKP